MNNSDGPSPVSWGLIKFISSYIPKWIKSWVGGIMTIVLGFFGSLIQTFVEGKEIVLPNITTFGIYFLSAIGLIFLIGLIIAYNKIAKDYYNKNTLSNSLIPRRNPLPSRFELKHLIDGELEYIILVKRKWFPAEPRPGKESFIQALEISEMPICSKCKANFYEEDSGFSCMICSRDEYDLDTLVDIGKRNLTLVKGAIRNDFDVYWAKYVEIYYQKTNGKPEDYEDPIKY